MDAVINDNGQVVMSGESVGLIKSLLASMEYEANEAFTLFHPNGVETFMAREKRDMAIQARLQFNKLIEEVGG